MSNPANGLLKYPCVEDFINRGTNGGLTCWYTGAVNQTPHTTGTAVFDNIWAYPIVLPGGIIDTIAFEIVIVGAAGSKCRSGLYRNTSENIIYPKELIIDGGEYLCDSATGVKTTSGLSVAVSPGLYWLITLAGVASPNNRALAAGCDSHILGIPVTMGATLNQRLVGAFAYQVLPATFPAGITVDNGGGVPLVALHFSS